MENDLGPDCLNESERDLTLVGLAATFEALPQPVSALPSQDPQRGGVGGEESKLQGGVELKELLSLKCVFHLTSTAESHITAYCYYGKAEILSRSDSRFFELKQIYSTFIGLQSIKNIVMVQHIASKANLSLVCDIVSKSLPGI